MIKITEYKGQAELAQEVLALLQDVYQPSPWTIEQIEADLVREDTVYYLAKDGRRLVGMLALQHVADEWELLQIAVARDVQGQGLAKKLLECLNLCKGSIFLEVRVSNHRAKSLYEQYGFVEIGRRKQYYHQPSEDAIIMKREKNER